MIYFDNAATCGKKPDVVNKKLESLIKSAGVNVGRGVYADAKKAEETVFNCRSFLSKTVNNGHIARLIFTSNCTHALNQMIFGVNLKGTEIVTSVTEHNSVLRPLYRLAEKNNLTLRFAGTDESGKVNAENLIGLLNEKTAFVILNAVSNVTGIKNDFEEIGRKINGATPYFVDCAQYGGHGEVNMQKTKISALAFAGHKGLYATQGIGALAVNKNIDLIPLMYGGSGSETFSKIPSCYPEKLEAGTLNYPAVVSLYYGAQYAYDNLNLTKTTLKNLTKRLIDGLFTFKHIKVYSPVNEFGIVSFEVENLSSLKLAEVFSENFGISVRGGFHCAPLMHKYLKTDENGLIRVSLSPFNTENEIDEFLNVLPMAISLCFKP